MTKIEKVYTGRGITCAEAELEGERYAVVSTECPELIAVYNRTEDDEPYLPEDMEGAYTEQELDNDMKALYNKMIEMLRVY